MEGTPTLRGFVRTLWPLVSNQFGRELKKMGRVRPELMRVVYSQLSEQEAAAGIREVVRSDPRGAKATLAYVTRIRDDACQYDTDRAYRVLRGALIDAPPEPARPDKAALFERQRELGWASLGEAFDQLADAVPELAHLAKTVESEPPNSTWIRRAQELVGPRSSQTDPLLRSSLASSVVARYLDVLSKDADRDRLRRPVWP